MCPCPCLRRSSPEIDRHANIHVESTFSFCCASCQRAHAVRVVGLGELTHQPACASDRFLVAIEPEKRHGEGKLHVKAICRWPQNARLGHFLKGGNLLRFRLNRGPRRGREPRGCVLVICVCGVWARSDACVRACARAGVGFLTTFPPARAPRQTSIPSHTHPIWPQVLTSTSAGGRFLARKPRPCQRDLLAPRRTSSSKQHLSRQPPPPGCVGRPCRSPYGGTDSKYEDRARASCCMTAMTSCSRTVGDRCYPQSVCDVPN